MKILYGTTNSAKLGLMRRVASDLGFEVMGLLELNKPLPVIDESGKDPLENAEIKARAYYEAFGMPVFSCDSGLYFDGIDDDLQPKTHVRRVNGKELSDEQMTKYYAELAHRHGGRLIARYRNAIYFIVDENTCFKRMDDSLASEPFILCDTPHRRKHVEGFPLDPLSVDIATGKYYYDCDTAPDKLAVAQGLHAFFEETLAKISPRR